MKRVGRKHIAETFGISFPTATNWLKRGGITPVSSKPFLYRWEDVERYAEKVLPRTRKLQLAQMKPAVQLSGRYTISVGALARLLKVPAAWLHAWAERGGIMWAERGVAFDAEDVLLAAEQRRIELRPDAVARLEVEVQLRRELV